MILLWLYRMWKRRRGTRAEVAAPQRAVRVGPTPTPRNTGALGMVLHQARYDVLGILRNGQARFFTLVMPILFLVIFVSVFGNDPVDHSGIKSSTYYVPGISAMAIIASAFVNLVISVTTERETGVYKRRRATPVPAWVLVAGRTLTATAVALTVMAVVIVIGIVAYGVHVNVAAIPAVVVTALLGSATFCVLAYAVASRITSEDSAQPVTQAIMLPLYFISGVFIPNVNLPSWLQQVAQIFPVQHLADGLHRAFDPTVSGAAFVWGDIWSLLIWSAVGIVVALRRFSWMPAAATA
jgi:ABC-2 type transport system permease protein